MEKDYNLLLVLPHVRTGQSSIKNESLKLSPVPLSLPYLASLALPNFDVSIVDERVEEIEFNNHVDIVGISVMTAAAPRAYEIADLFRNQGTTVVMGGVHPTLLPEEASKHADAVVKGEGEGVWQQLLMDYQRNGMKRIYRRSEPYNMKGMPHPRWDLMNREAYLGAGTLQTTRGCPHNCTFCSIRRFYGRKYRIRPVSEVIEEVTNMKERFLGFLDSDIAANPNCAKRLFKALTPLKKFWASDAGIKIANDDELVKLAAESGCKALFIGFESMSQASLMEAGKLQNNTNYYKEAIAKLHDYGISVFGGFIFGFDNDDKSIFERTVEFAVKSKLDFVDFNALCPYPGTTLYERFGNEDRIIDTDWSKYIGNNIVFRPKQMTPEDLKEGCIQAWKDFYSFKSISRRFLSKPNFSSWVNFLAYFLLNVGTKKRISKFQ